VIDIDSYLLRVPKKYENRFLSEKIELNSINVFEAEIRKVSKNDNRLNINIFIPKFNQYIKAVIFHIKSFHLSIWTYPKKVFLIGKINNDKYQNIQILQPKIIPYIDVIHTSYTRIAYKNYISKHLNKKSLLATNLPLHIIDILLQIHSPSLEFYENNLKFGYENKALYALKFIEMFIHIRALNSKKKEYPSLRKLNSNIDELINNFPFTLTKGQCGAIDDIRNDLNKDKASKRIIMGDVGCGKSAVIFASLLTCFPYKSIVMAPTTILATQLYNEATKYLPNKVNLQLITSSTKEDISKQSHILIGTHALLYKDLPKETSLIIVDEQHKFGTNQRYSLDKSFKQGKKRAHFLQFSATPIPRTMSMIESSIVDFSFIKDTPFKRDVSSKLINKKDFNDLLAHIKNEISKNNQIIIVYPLTNQSESIKYKSLDESKDFWLKNFNDVYFTHGKDTNKEKVLEDFAITGSILLTTTMVEVGISLPRVSTMIIIGAERFGLSTLHQLRGRVSRIGLKGYVFLWSNKIDNEKLERFIKTNNGFEIASLDLEYRNSGDLLSGYIQSGKNFKYIDLSEDEDIIEEVKIYMAKI